jgi:hypothetical protein
LATASASLVRREIASRSAWATRAMIRTDSRCHSPTRALAS